MPDVDVGNLFFGETSEGIVVGKNGTGGPFKVDRALSGCGCTSLAYERQDEIMPGEEFRLKVRAKIGKVGPFAIRLGLETSSVDIFFNLKGKVSARVDLESVEPAGTSNYVVKLKLNDDSIDPLNVGLLFKSQTCVRTDALTFRLDVPSRVASGMLFVVPKVGESLQPPISFSVKTHQPPALISRKVSLVDGGIRLLVEGSLDEVIEGDGVLEIDGVAHRVEVQVKKIGQVAVLRVEIGDAAGADVSGDAMLQFSNQQFNFEVIGS